MKSSYNTLIIGAGLSGLACAAKCQRQGVDFLLIEKQSRLGGRVGSIMQDGFVLDLGFQVYNTSYSATNELLGQAQVDYLRFQPGAAVHINGKFKVLSDPFRDPASLFQTLTFPKATLMDKWKVQKLRQALAGFDPGRCPEDRMSTADYLQNYGFSQTFIDYFFRPFFSGVFLENELSTASQFFKYVFSSFNRGYASLPAQGMQEIPDTMAREIDPQRLLLNTSVECLLPNKQIRLGDGRVLGYEHLVLTGESVQLSSPYKYEYHPVCTLYYATSVEALYRNYIHLFPEDDLLNHVAFVSAIAPGYAPPQETLLSVSVLGDATHSATLEAEIASRLSHYYGGTPKQYRLIHNFNFRKGTLSQKPGFFSDTKPSHPEVIFAGEYFLNGSIEGAVQSGLNAFATLQQRSRN